MYFRQFIFSTNNIDCSGQSKTYDFPLGTIGGTILHFLNANVALLIPRFIAMIIQMCCSINDCEEMNNYLPSILTS